MPESKTGPSPAPANRFDYPLAPWRPEVEHWPGEDVVDGLRWLERADDPEVLGWVARENAFTDAYFARELGDELRAREEFLRMRAARVTYSHVTRVEDGYVASACSAGEYGIVRLDDDFSDPTPLFSAGNASDPCKVYSAEPCPGDPNLLAVCVLFDHAPRLSVLVRDLAGRRQLARLDGLFVWAWDVDGAYLYYSDAEGHPEEARNANYIRRWCRATGEVELVATVRENAVYCSVEPDDLGGLFIMVRPDYATCRVYHLDADALRDGGDPVLVSGDVRASFAYVGTLRGRHLLLTNWGAQGGRVVSLDARDLCLDDARELISQVEGTVLVGAAVAGEALLCARERDGAVTLELRRADADRAEPVELPDEPATVTGEGRLAVCRPGQHEALLEFEGFRAFKSVIAVDCERGVARLLGAQAEGAGAEDADVVVERVEVPSRDGSVALAAYLVHRAGLVPDGEVPTLFFGYGGYNACLNPDRTNPFVGLDPADWAHRGGLYVHCILRGGGERGPAWHDAGCLANKGNVFDDFADIIAHVQGLGWTTSGRSAICGGSNGGLLVTATITRNPGLVGCAVASVPHTDMLRFVHDDRGPMYITEYGDPRDPALYPVLRGYSPYHNIRPGQAYPSLYVQTGELDNNVPPYHGKKFAARMQLEASPERPTLLRVLPRGAHDRGQGDAYFRTVAEMQCFLERCLGMS